MIKRIAPCQQTSTIGNMLSLYGALSVLIQLLLFPPLVRRIGVVSYYRIFLPGFSFAALAAIILNQIAMARNPGMASAGKDVFVIGCVAVIVAVKATVNTCFSCTVLLINAS